MRRQTRHSAHRGRIVDRSYHGLRYAFGRGYTQDVHVHAGIANCERKCGVIHQHQRTFYYLCSILNGYSRYIVNWDLMKASTSAGSGSFRRALEAMS